MEQKQDPILKPMIEYLEGGVTDHTHTLPDKGKFSKFTAPTFTLNKNGVLMKKATENGVARTVIPQTKVRDVMNDTHDQILGGHYGENKTYQKIISKFWWASAYKDIREWCRNCEVCALNKGNSKPTKAALIPIKPKAVFELLGIDIMGPMNTTPRNNRYIVCFVCLFSKYAEAVAVPAIDAPLIARCMSFQGMASLREFLLTKGLT